MKFSDVAAQRTLTQCADAPTECEDDTLTTDRDLLDRAQAHAADVAAEHFPALPVDAIEWEISHRAKQQAGVTKYDPDTDAITIRLSWDAYNSHGWEQFSSTVRHELNLQEPVYSSHCNQVSMSVMIYKLFKFSKPVLKVWMADRTLAAGNIHFSESLYGFSDIVFYGTFRPYTTRR
jgi:hypothetical protein